MNENENNAETRKLNFAAQNEVATEVQAEPQPDVAEETEIAQEENMAEAAEVEATDSVAEENPAEATEANDGSNQGEEAEQVFNTEANDGASLNDLQAEKDRVDAQIAAQKAAERKNVIDQIVNVAKTYDVPLQEIVDAMGGLKRTRKGSPAKPKYKDPETGTTWSGRGKEPLWIRGKDREKFLITE